MMIASLVLSFLLILILTIKFIVKRNDYILIYKNLKKVKNYLEMFCSTIWIFIGWFDECWISCCSLCTGGKRCIIVSFGEGRNGIINVGDSNSNSCIYVVISYLFALLISLPIIQLYLVIFFWKRISFLIAAVMYYCILLILLLINFLIVSIYEKIVKCCDNCKNKKNNNSASQNNEEINNTINNNYINNNRLGLNFNKQNSNTIEVKQSPAQIKKIINTKNTIDIHNQRVEENDMNQA